VDDATAVFQLNVARNHRSSGEDAAAQVCPGGYQYVEGDVPVWDQFGRAENITRITVDLCAVDCNAQPDCRSFKWSMTTTICSLHKVAEPTVASYKDYILCQRKKDCPSGYEFISGSGPKWSTGGSDKPCSFDMCAADCTQREDCLSIEWSPSTRLCRLNNVAHPTNSSLLDYVFCRKTALNTKLLHAVNVLQVATVPATDEELVEVLAEDESESSQARPEAELSGSPPPAEPAVTEGCPAGWVFIPGDIPGGDQFNQRNNHKDSIDLCAAECSKRKLCASLEWSPSKKMCNLNKDPVAKAVGTKFKDFILCQRAPDSPPPETTSLTTTTTGAAEAGAEAMPVQAGGRDTALPDVEASEDGVTTLKASDATDLEGEAEQTKTQAEASAKDLPLTKATTDSSDVTRLHQQEAGARGNSETTVKGNPDCWVQGYSFDACCNIEFGTSGNPNCWDGGHFTFRRCCLTKESQATSTSIELIKPHFQESYEAGDMVEIANAEGSNPLVAWLPCIVTGLGEKPRTYSVILKFAPDGHRDLHNIPVQMLRKVEAQRYQTASQNLAEEPDTARQAALQVEHEVQELEDAAMALHAAREGVRAAQLMLEDRAASREVEYPPQLSGSTGFNLLSNGVAGQKLVPASAYQADRGAPESRESRESSLGNLPATPAKTDVSKVQQPDPVVQPIGLDAPSDKARASRWTGKYKVGDLVEAKTEKINGGKLGAWIPGSISGKDEALDTYTIHFHVNSQAFRDVHNVPAEFLRKCEEKKHAPRDRKFKEDQRSAVQAIMALVKEVSKYKPPETKTEGSLTMQQGDRAGHMQSDKDQNEQSEATGSVLSVEEEVKRRVEAEMKRRAEEKSRKSEEGARLRREEETRRQEEEELRRRTEEEVRRKTEDEIRRRTEEEIRRRTEEEIQRRTDDGVQSGEDLGQAAQALPEEDSFHAAVSREKSALEARWAAEAAQRKAGLLAKRKEAAQLAEQEVHRKVEEGKRQAEGERRKAEMEREIQRRVEEEKRRIEEERQRAEAERAVERRVEEEKRKIEEEKRKIEEERRTVEAARRGEEDERRRAEREAAMVGQRLRLPAEDPASSDDLKRNIQLRAKTKLVLNRTQASKVALMEAQQPEFEKGHASEEAERPKKDVGAEKQSSATPPKLMPLKKGEEGEFLRVFVKDKGKPTVQLKVQRRARLKVLMRAASERLKISEAQSVFTHDGVTLKADGTVGSLGLQDQDVIMVQEAVGI